MLVNSDLKTGIASILGFRRAFLYCIDSDPECCEGYGNPDFAMDDVMVSFRPSTPTARIVGAITTTADFISLFPMSLG